MKTSDLTGAALDWAVAQCEGIKTIGTQAFVTDEGFEKQFCPSADWAQGGPIIEREGVEVGPAPGVRPVGEVWLAKLPCGPESRKHRQHGSTPLIVAMRCYVASKLGDEIEIPAELMP